MPKEPSYAIKLPPKKLKLLERIALEFTDVPTLQSRHMDSLDFHDVAVWGLLRALNEAYEAGKASVS